MIKETITLADAADMFDDCLNSDVNGSVTIAGIEFLASEILKRCDPVAYRCALNNYLDCISYDFEIEGFE